MKLNSTRTLLHRPSIEDGKSSRELISEAFSLVRRLHLPRRNNNPLQAQAVRTRAINLFSPTFTTWNRFS